MSATDAARDKLAGMMSHTMRQMRRLLSSIVSDLKTSDGKIERTAYNISRLSSAMRALKSEMSARGLDNLRREMQRQFDVIADDAMKISKAAGIDEIFSDASRQAISVLADSGDREIVAIAGKAADQVSAYLAKAVLGGANRDDVLLALERILDVAEHQAEAVIQTVLNSFFRQVLVMQAQENGVEEFAYLGPDDEIVREWCSHWVGRRGTLEEFEETADQWGRDGQPLPVSVFGGGYNCRHRFVPVTSRNRDKYERGPA